MYVIQGYADNTPIYSHGSIITNFLKFRVLPVGRAMQKGHGFEYPRHPKKKLWSTLGVVVWST